MANKPLVKKKKKDNSNRNGNLAFCITAVAYAAIFGLKNLSGFIICGLLSLLVSSIVRVATKPMKGLEAPSNSSGIIVEDVEDQFAQEIIANGLKMMDELVGERNLIGEPIFTKRINDFISVYREMLNIVVRDYSKASQLRKMNTYYVPTIIKLLRSYRDAKAQGTSYMEISATREKLLKTLDQLVQAARNVKKTMVKSKLETMDITREVLDDMLRADGYIEDEETAGLRTSAAQASQQMTLPEQMAAPAPAQPAARAQKPAPAQPQSPKAQPLTPGIRLQETQQARQSTPVPQLQTSMPTASAQQMNQGAPVLHVPGLIPEEEDASSDNEQTLML